jgi:hypothetical protein
MEYEKRTARLTRPYRLSNHCAARWIQANRRPIAGAQGYPQ